MELIKPSFGLLVWMLIGFGILFLILRYYAWPVITKMIHAREQFIQNQLTEAENVKMEMNNMKSEHQKMIIEAKDERDKILKNARKMVEKINDDAKTTREKEAEMIMAETRSAIENEKMKAITDIKNEIANLSIEIAEKILREELNHSLRQEEVIHKWIADMKI